MRLPRSIVLPLLVLAAGLPLEGAAGRAPSGDLVGPPYQRLIERVARRHRLDPDLLEALVEVESGRNASARSRKGAVGLAQLMPETARRFGAKDPLDAEDNLEAAARYLRYLLGRYRGDLRLTLAAWNAGEGAVERFHGVPPYPETIAFVRKVLQRLRAPEGRSASVGGGRNRVRVERDPAGRIVVTNR